MWVGGKPNVLNWVKYTNVTCACFTHLLFFIEFSLNQGHGGAETSSTMTVTLVYNAVGQWGVNFCQSTVRNIHHMFTLDLGPPLNEHVPAM